MKKLLLIALSTTIFSCNTKPKYKNRIYIQATAISYVDLYGIVDKGSRFYEMGENKQIGFYVQAFRDGDKINEALTDSANLSNTIELMKSQILFKDSTICL